MMVSVCSGFYSFLTSRLLLGLFEGPVLPVGSHIVSIWNPVRERTFATSCFNCATKIGSAFGPFIVAYLIAAYGWRSSFVITGVMGSLWGLAYIWMYRDPGDHPTISASELAYIRQDELMYKQDEKNKIKTLQYFTYRPVVQSGIAYFFMLYFFSVAAFWTPTYFVKSWGVSIKEMGILASFPWVICFVSELIGGKFWDMLVRRGVSTNNVRRIGLGVTVFGPAIFCLLIPTSTTALQGALYVSLALGSFGFGNSNLFASIVDLAPPGDAGKLVGLVSVIGNIGGMVGPAVTGYVVEMGYGFNGAFLICSLTSALSGLFYIFNNYNRLVARS